MTHLGALSNNLEKEPHWFSFPSTKASDVTLVLALLFIIAISQTNGNAHAAPLPSPYNSFSILTRIKSPPVSSSDLTTRRSLFGARVAMSADGNVAAVMAPDNRLDSDRVGGAYIFTKSPAGGWVQQGDTALVGTGASPPSFQGSSMAMSRDGNLLFVAGHYDSDARGAVWCFRREPSGVFAQHGSKLNPGTPASTYFGINMALSKDRTTLAVSSYKKAFAVVVYTISQIGDISQQAVLQLDVPSDEGIGNGIAITADGNRLIVSQTDTDNPHHLYVYTRSGTTWTFTEGLRGTNGIGYSLALSDDGIHLFAGPGEAMASSEYWVLVDGKYTRRQIITKPPGSSIIFASTDVKMLSNGKRLVIGDAAANRRGRVPIGAYYFYENSGNGWTQVPGNLSLIAYPETYTLPMDPDRAFLGVGLSMAMSDDGKDILVGAYGDSENGTVWFLRSEVGVLGSEAVTLRGSLTVTLVTVLVGWIL